MSVRPRQRPVSSGMRRRLFHLGITTLLVLAGFVLVPDRAPIVSAQTGDRMLTAVEPAATRLRAPALSQPPTLSGAEIARLQAISTTIHRKGPGTQDASGPLALTPEVAVQPTIPLTAPSSQAPDANTFTFITNNDLGAGAPASATSVVGEPTVANTGSYVFETGNWYAAISSNGGVSFSYINPYTTFPSMYGGFCCDQSVLYEPSHDITVWLLMYVNNASGNAMRLAIANGQADLASQNFHYFDFSPQSLNFPAGDWYDYPHMEVGSTYLYVTVNVFQGNNSTFDGTVVLRLPLSALASGSSFTYNAYVLDRTRYFTATLTQGAGSTMYFATHVSNTSLRVYAWPESGNPTATNISHAAYSTAGVYTCPGPDGRDWCGRSDDRVMTGWVSNGLLGFMWNAPKGSSGLGSFAYPYVQILLVKQSSMTAAGQSAMSNPGYAFMYPSAGVNARGHIAGSVFYGGGSLYPTLGTYVWDDLSLSPYPTLPTNWETYAAAASTQGPLNNAWGDYTSARGNFAGPSTRNLWIASGYSLAGGGSNGYARPREVVFGRSRDNPRTTQTNNLLFVPLVAR